MLDWLDGQMRVIALNFGGDCRAIYNYPLDGGQSLGSSTLKPTADPTYLVLDFWKGVLPETKWSLTPMKVVISVDDWSSASPLRLKNM